MKKIIFLFFLGMSVCTFNVFSQIKVSSSGNVGINNTNPTYKLDINGNVRIVDGSYNFLFSGTTLSSTSSSSQLGNTSYFWGYLYARNIFYYYPPTQYSDMNLKTDIKELTPVGNSLMKLRPVKYKMIPKLNEGETLEDLKGVNPDAEQIGFLAQEIQLVFPELVVSDDQGTLGIRYMELIPLLVKAYQEQQMIISDLKTRIEKLEAAGK